MSLFRSRKSAAVQPDFSGLALQTSTAAAAIPIVYGTTRVAPNIITRCFTVVAEGRVFAEG